MSSVDLLASVLCYGLNPDLEVLESWSSITPLAPGFIQGIPIRIGESVVNTSVVDRMSWSDNALSVHRDSDGSFLQWNGERVPVRPVQQPKAAWHSVSGRQISQVLTLHNESTIFATPVRECIFGAIGKGCTFCTFDMSKPKPLSRGCFQEMIEKFSLEFDLSNFSVAFGGGTPDLRDHGISYYADLASVLSPAVESISVELVPPLKVSLLDCLVDVGVESLVMSIEVWDDEIRARVCPGKNRVSKDVYLEAWSHAESVLGPGRVSSVLLVGLETEESSRAGIRSLISNGVLPTLIPFRPYDSAELSDHPLTEVEQYKRLSRYCSYLLEQSGLNPRTQKGCAACGACSLELFLTA